MTDILISVDLDDLRTQVQLPAGCVVVVALRLPSGQLVELSDLRNQDRRELGEPGPGVRSDRVAIHEAAMEDLAEAEATWDAREAEARKPVVFTDIRAWLSAFVVTRSRGHMTAATDDARNRTIGYRDLETGLVRVIEVNRFKATWVTDAERGIRGVDEGLARQVMKLSATPVWETTWAAGVDLIAGLWEMLANRVGRSAIFGPEAEVEPLDVGFADEAGTPTG